MSILFFWTYIQKHEFKTIYKYIYVHNLDPSSTKPRTYVHPNAYKWIQVLIKLQWKSPRGSPHWQGYHLPPHHTSTHLGANHQVWNPQASTMARTPDPIWKHLKLIDMFAAICLLPYLGNMVSPTQSVRETSDHEVNFTGIETYRICIFLQIHIYIYIHIHK